MRRRRNTGVLILMILSAALMLGTAFVLPDYWPVQAIGSAILGPSVAHTVCTSDGWGRTPWAVKIFIAVYLSGWCRGPDLNHVQPPWLGPALIGLTVAAFALFTWMQRPSTELRNPGPA